MIYITLFWSFFQIGLLSIGGGYAAIPVIQNQIVDINRWLTITEFTDLITIAEMTPGPIAINSATFIGTQVAGTSGAVIATIGYVLPSCIIVLAFAYLYKRFKEFSVVNGILKGLRPAIVAMIASAGLTILILSFWGEGGFTLNISDINAVSVCLFFIGLYVLRKFKPNPIFVIAGSGIIGMIVYLLI